MAHIVGQGSANYDAYSALVVQKAVDSALGGPRPLRKVFTITDDGQRIQHDAHKSRDQWAGLLAVYSSALAGDSKALASWSAIESHDPDLARLVVKAASAGVGVTSAARNAALSEAGRPAGKVAKPRKVKSRGVPASQTEPGYDEAIAYYAAAGNPHAMRLLNGF